MSFQNRIPRTNSLTPTVLPANYQKMYVPLHSSYLILAEKSDSQDMTSQMKKEGWPDFPYWWESRSEWNMTALRDIARHLQDKTAQRRLRSGQGYRGESTDMEKQIFQHIEDLEQQVFELEDAVQALLQIIDDSRPSQRAKRCLRWIRAKMANIWRKIEQNAVYRIVAAIGVFATLYPLYLVIKFVFAHFHIWTK